MRKMTEGNDRMTELCWKIGYEDFHFFSIFYQHFNSLITNHTLKCQKFAKRLTNKISFFKSTTLGCISNSEVNLTGPDLSFTQRF